MEDPAMGESNVIPASAAQELIAQCLAGNARAAWKTRRRNPEFEAADHAALTAVFESGRVDAVPLLLAVGLDVSCRDAAGRLPLHLAAGAGELDVLKLILAAGADPDQADGAGRTALEHALSITNVDLRRSVVRALLAAGTAPAAIANFPCGDLALDEELERDGFRA